MSGKTTGIVDLHTHLLPNMDDGSKDTAMSLEMLRRQAEQGVNVVCATSHLRNRRRLSASGGRRRWPTCAAPCRRMHRGFSRPLRLPFCGHRPREGAGNAVH